MERVIICTTLYSNNQYEFKLKSHFIYFNDFPSTLSSIKLKLISYISFSQIELKNIKYVGGTVILSSVILYCYFWKKKNQ